MGQLRHPPDDTYAQPDNGYTVCEPAYSMPHAVVVAAYNSAKTYTNLNGVEQMGDYGAEGDICTFSNCGPSLHAVPQPTVTAPGSMIISAVSKYEAGFSRTASNITGDVKRGLKHFYYGAYAGTSMATPMVTGAVALWLQANPRLTHEQIHRIIRQTAVVPEGYTTDDNGWNAQWGYGRLDTYEGLKLALQLRDNNTAIHAMEGSYEPFTLNKEQRRWRILFNSSEPWAEVTVSSTRGTLAMHQRLNAVPQGYETTLDLGDIPPGVYLIRLETAHAIVVRKVALH